MGTYGKSAAKKAANKKHRAIRSKNTSLRKPATTGQAANVDSRYTQASRNFRVAPQDGATHTTAGQGVCIIEPTRSAPTPTSSIVTTPLQPSVIPFTEPAEEETAPCHLEPSERSSLLQNASTFQIYTSSHKPLERSGAVIQISASVPRMGEAPAPPAPLQAPAADDSAEEQPSVAASTLGQSPMQLQEQGSMDASPFQTPAADASPDEQPSTTIPALEQSPMRLQEQGSTDASAFQAPAADDSTDQLLFATVAVLEQSIMQPREQGSTGTPFEEGSLEAAGGKDITSDDAPMAAIQISFSPSSTKSNDGLLTRLFRTGSSLLGKLSSSAASSGRCAVQTAISAGAVPIKAAAAATTVTAGLSLGAAVGSAAVVMTAASITGSAIAPVVESGLIQMPLKAARCAAAPVATCFLQPAAVAATSFGSAGMYAIEMAPAVAASLFPKTAKYIRCKLSASPTLEDLEGSEWLARRRALLEAAVADYANSSQDSDGDDSTDEDESDEEGDMDLKDMDSAFQLSPVASPTY